MGMLTPGQRLQISDGAEFRIQFQGPGSERIGVAGINRHGAVMPFDRQGNGIWHCQNINQLGDQIEVVAYILDDRQGGFVNESYPVEVTLEGNTSHLPEPAQQLAAVILAEIYIKNSIRRIKISNEGFTFGIDAYARARNLTGMEVPFRTKPAPQDERQTDPGRQGRSHSPGQMLGTGSGVLIGPDLVITNAHVIEDGSNFHAGRGRDRLVPIAVDPLHDLALLQGQTAGNILPIRISSPIWLGESVIAAGYPLMDVLGSDIKVTTGNISGLTGGMGDVSRFQFTAPIGSGSSGGAIVDECGNLVGIIAASLAHRNVHDRGSISENVNFGVKAAMVFELIAAAGLPLPQSGALTDTNRRDVVNRIRSCVVSISVSA
jgi:S1-C subfamily serine protease